MKYVTGEGNIEVVCGPMFAGKTEELIRRIKRLQYAKKNFLVFKPKLDDRYTSEAKIVSHSQQMMPSKLVEHSFEVLNYIHADLDAVIIDEAQFFDDGIIKVVNDLADKGIRVIIGGLDMDFKGQPFGPMPYLLAIAEQVTKLSAICVKTGLPATRTQRLINGRPACINQPVIQVGASESYEPRARVAHKLTVEE